MNGCGLNGGRLVFYRDPRPTWILTVPGAGRHPMRRELEASGWTFARGLRGDGPGAFTSRDRDTAETTAARFGLQVEPHPAFAPGAPEVTF